MSGEAEIIDGLMQDAEAALARGAVAKATSLYQGILAVNPDHVAALRQLGAVAVNSGEPEKALELFRLASKQDPNDPDLYHGMATALRLMGRIEESIMALNATLRVDGNHTPALYDKALLLKQKGNFAGAQKLFLDVAARDAGHFDAVFNRGVALFKADNLLAAERWFQQAARLKPKDPQPYINLAMIYRAWGHVPEAVSCVENAVKVAPDNADAHWNLANALLVSGDFARGFAAYEWRFKRSKRAERVENVPKWAGDALLNRRILLTAEQGMGDIIHFIRFAKHVADMGGRVIAECHPGLEKLIKTAPGVRRAVPIGGAVPDAEVYFPLMSLPHILGTTLETLPATVPYLSVPPDAPAVPVTGDGLRVGLVWRGNPMHEQDHWRSVDLQKLAPLFAVPGVKFFSLQVGVAAEELKSTPEAKDVTDLAPYLADFSATAAAVNALDLIITVDTAVAHLAGALAKPAWVLIQRGNDWRWLSDRSDSPWYPTLKLFRQARPRNWNPVIRAMTEELTALAKSKSSATITPS